MQPVSDDVLLAVAQIAATLMGLFLVGVVFYAEAGSRRLGALATPAARYLRAGIRFVLLLYSLVLALSMALIVLEPGWVMATFVTLAVAIVGSLVSFTLRAHDLLAVMPRMHPVSLWLAWPPVVVALGLPWALGGWSPDRLAFTPTLLVATGVAFVATAGLVLLAFDLAAFELDDAVGGSPPDAPGAAE
jgi:hypothetical protein